MVGLLACEQDPIIFTTPEGFLQVAEESLSVTENSEDPVAITILYGNGTNPNGVTVNYTVTAADPSRFTLTPSTGSITIPAGEFSADLILDPVDNFDVDGDAEVVITLSTDSDVPVGIGGEGNFSTSTTITIIDNDCPIDIESFVGTYDVFENFTGGQNAPLGLADFFGESYQLEMTLAANDPTGTKLEVNNSAGFDVYINDGSILVFDTCNNQISFEGGFPTVALFRTFEYTGSSYSEENGVIQATGPLATFGPYQFTFTKQD